MGKKNQQEIAVAEVKEITGPCLAVPNYALALFYQLLNIPLHGKISRARNHIAQMIKDRVVVIEDERIKMLEQFAPKDKKTGKFILRHAPDGTEEYDIPQEKMTDYNKEFTAFMAEKTIFDLVPSIKSDLVLIRPLILESNVKLETPDGYVYDDLCKLFEAI